MNRAWSGSSLGYQSKVYHEGLEEAPAGARFDAEWGLRDRAMFSGTRGSWREYCEEDVRAEILRRAGGGDLAGAREGAAQVSPLLESARAEALSILTVENAERSDPYLTSIGEQIGQIRLRTAREFEEAMVPRGQVMTRDTVAASGGFRAAPHQKVMAEIAEITQVSAESAELSRLIRQAGSHLIRLEQRVSRVALVGTNVFIGHGQSLLWREVKDFVADRLRLPYDEFNRVPVAGVTNIARLSQMLDSAAIALIVLTAEDEQADGAMNARQNVIHEAGLFQGRLGFTKAIVLLEEGCQEFSNIQGLGQIRFPRGNISAAFEEVRRVLEREQIVQPH